MSITAGDRFTADRPCPICAGWERQVRGEGKRCNGYVDSTGAYARCSREEKAGEIEQNADGTFSHRLAGPCGCGVEHGPADERRSETVRHVIRDIAGGPVAVHARKGTGKGKTVWWERPDGSSGLNGTRPADMLYGLEQLAGLDDGTPVLLTEGEPAADAAVRLGYVALGTVTGAGTDTAPHRLSATVAAHLAGRTVLLFPDADAPGRAHMAANAEVLRAAGAEVLVLDWPEAPERADAADLVRRLGVEAARERLREIIAIAGMAPGVVPDEAEGEPHPWTPIALDPETITPPAPPSILLAADGRGALLYAGMRHLLFGETEALKSWVSAACAVELAHAGRDTVWIDTDGMGRGPLAERLGALGLDDDEIRRHVFYLAPDVALDAEGTEALVRVLEERDVALCAIDAHDASLELQGLDPNSTADVQKFARTVVDIFHRRGIATLVPDHVARGGDGKDPIASQRKVTGFDVAISIKLDGEPMTRSRPTAKVLLYGRKDRPGWHERQGHERRLGEIHFDLRAEPPWRLILSRGEEGERPQIPSVLMERVSRYLESHSDPMSKTAIETDVMGSAKGVRWAVDVLLQRGCIEAAPGRRKGDRVYLSVRPFREADADEPVLESVPPKTPEAVSTRPGTRPLENPAPMRHPGNPSEPVPIPSPTRPVNPSPNPAPLEGAGDGTGSLERCASCGKRRIQTEPGEPLCRCDDDLGSDWRELVPDEGTDPDGWPLRGVS